MAGMASCLEAEWDQGVLGCEVGEGASRNLGLAPNTRTGYISMADDAHTMTAYITTEVRGQIRDRLPDAEVCCHVLCDAYQLR